MQWLSRILDLLFPPRDTEQLVREATLDGVLAHLHPSSEGGIVSLLPYRTPLVRALVKEAKYKGNTRAQELLGRVLSEYLTDWSQDREAFESRAIAIVPIPLSRKRHAERGYNQVREIARHAGFSLTERVLRRTRDTKAQTTLGRAARGRNMEGAFTAQSPDPSLLYIVVDDVTTTGATLREAVAALKAGDAQYVEAVAIAH